MREVLNTKNDPLAVLIEIANDPENHVQTRMQAAAAAAPYMFPRLSATVVAHAPVNAKEDTANLIERLSQRFAKLVTVQTIEGEPASCSNATLPQDVEAVA